MGLAVQSTMTYVVFKVCNEWEDTFVLDASLMVDHPYRYFSFQPVLDDG